IVNTHFDALVARPYVGAYFFPGTSDGSPNRPVIESALPKLEAQFAMLDRAVAKTGYLVGGAFTLADMNVLPMLFYLHHLPESGAMLGRVANLASYYERHIARPTVKEALVLDDRGRLTMRYMFLVYSREKDFAEASPQALQRVKDGHWAVMDKTRQ